MFSFDLADNFKGSEKSDASRTEIHRKPSHQLHLPHSKLLVGEVSVSGPFTSSAPSWCECSSAHS